MRELQRITVNNLGEPNTQDFCYSKVSHICNTYGITYKECADKLKTVTAKGKKVGYVFAIFKNESIKKPNINKIPLDISNAISDIVKSKEGS
jgi:hypothetical protein